MASKSDLLDAQGFSRRRLLTAFVSGAPGGRELEPAKPLRGVVAGISLSIVVLLIGLFISLMQKGLPSDWGNGKLIIDQSTGSRYVTVDDELWPILNIASARLLLEPDASAKPIVVSGGLLTGIPVRDTIGIPGAPDTIPAPGKLVNTGWTACVANETGQIDTRILSQPIASQTALDEATVVTFEDRIWVISGGLRMEVPASSADAILRDVGLGSAPQHVVTTNWLNLFEEGDALAPLTVGGAGEKLADSELRVGDVIFTTTTDASVRYLVLRDGSLAELSPLAFALYQHGSSYSAERTFEVDGPAIASMPNTSTPVTSADWPRATFRMMPAQEAPCALTTDNDGTAQSVLASVADTDELAPQTIVEPSMGALVNVAGFGQDEGAVTLLIDSTATSYAIPGADESILAKLGYSSSDAGTALAPWLQLFNGGPDLTQAAAGARSDGSTK